jgi:hypothetical protein
MTSSPSSPRTEIAAGGLARLRILDELQILTPYQKKEETEESHLLNWIPLPSEVPSTPHETTTSLPFSSTTSDLENFVKRLQDQHQKKVKHQNQATSSSSFSSSSATSSKKISSISVEKSSSFTGGISDEKLGNLNNSNNSTSEDLQRGSQLRPSASTPSVHQNLHLELSPKATTYKPEDEPLLTPSPIVKGSVMSPRIVIDSKESEECLARGIKLFNEKPKKVRHLSSFLRSSSFASSQTERECRGDESISPLSSPSFLLPPSMVSSFHQSSELSPSFSHPLLIFFLLQTGS